MERCFIIEKDDKLYKDYYDRLALRAKNNEIIKMFAAEMLPDCKDFSYVANSKTFSIILSDVEYTKYKSQLKQDFECTEQGKLYTFKKTSRVGKAYAALNITAAHRPLLIRYLDINTCRYRLFDYNDVLYASIDSSELNRKSQFPQGWKELSKSEFYAVIEQAEREEDENSTDSTGDNTNE